MIVRNAIKSVVRTPIKSILFFLLALTLGATMTLGSALAVMCSALRDRCDKTYITIASIEYRGGRFPDKAVSDEKAAMVRAGIDFNALGKQEGVTAVDRSDTAIVAIPGLSVTLDQYSSTHNAVVMVVRKIYDDRPLAKVEKVLYAESIMDGSFINMHVRDSDGNITDFEGEAGHRYLISGFTDGKIAGIIDVYMGPLVNSLAESAGIQQQDYVLDVSSDKNLSEPEPAYDQFIDAANAYSTINVSWYARISKDPSFLEPFVEKEYSFSQGGFYPAKSDDGKSSETVYCLLPEIVASNLDLGAGDKIPLNVTQTGFSSINDSYWPLGKNGALDQSSVLECVISGVFSTTAKEVPLIYLSGLGSAADLADGFCGYTLGTLHLRNGITQEEISRIKELLPEKAEMAVYDQGYGAVTEALEKLFENAVSVTIAAVIATAVMLVLFAFVFVGRQSDAIISMYLMGTPTRSLAAYVATAAALILIPGAIAGNILSFGLSGILTRLIDRTVKDGQSILRMYSSSDLGIIQPIEPSIRMSALPGIICGAGLCAAGILMCLLFLVFVLRKVNARAYEDKRQKKREQALADERSNGTKRLAKNVKPLGFSGAAVKYVVISLIRGGVRSVAVPLVSLAMAVFILVPVTALSNYKKQLNELNESTVIKCYFTDYSGKRRYDLVLMDNMVGTIVDCEYFSDFHFSLCDAFAVNRTFRTVSPGNEQISPDMVHVPTYGSFAYENFITNFLNGPKLFYTDDITSTPEFAGRASAEMTWLDGYDFTYFTQEREAFEGVIQNRYSSAFSCTADLREFCVAVPEDFLEEYGLKLGDSVELMVSEDLVHEKYKIIGSFRSVSSAGFIYTRLDNCHKVMYINEVGKYTVYHINQRTSSSSGTFRLTDTSKIREAKEWLRNTGYSRLHSVGYYRLYPVFEDAEYCEAVGKLEKNIGYLEKVLPAMAALVLLSGFAAAYLLTFRRRMEIATLRSIGETDRRVFAIFSVEQILPAIIGTAAGICIWLGIAGLGNMFWLAFAFLAGFSAGTIFAAKRMSKANLLEVLSEKD
ncbi:MAG: hypothetical protein J5950_03210 [Clostridia bacterium]|nr:hypothetical protein [Clostridia bacterium]